MLNCPRQNVVQPEPYLFFFPNCKFTVKKLPVSVGGGEACFHLQENLFTQSDRFCQQQFNDRRGKKRASLQIKSTLF